MKTKIHYRVDTNLSQNRINPVRNIITYIFKINFNIVFSLEHAYIYERDYSIQFFRL